MQSETKAFRFLWRLHYTLMLSSSFVWKARIACPPSRFYSAFQRALLSLVHAFVLILFHPGTTLAHLDLLPSYDLVVYSDGSVSFGKEG